MNAALDVRQWAAWAPGLDAQSAWLDWLRAPRALPADAPASPPLLEVPAMARRRIEPLGRMAMQVAFQVQADLDEAQVAAMPLVFGSRWGELAKSVAMQQELAVNSSLSPTAFSHCVHNAIAAQYSIQRRITANVSAVAGGPFSMEAAWIEAMGLLADGANEVLVVVFDAPMPDLYQALLPATPFTPSRAIALRLGLAPAGAGVELVNGVASADDMDPLLPADLAVLRFLLSDLPSFRHATAGRCWSWQRRHAN
jgi:Beta-ketoacyl synthase, N-terminal domain